MSSIRSAFDSLVKFLKDIFEGYKAIAKKIGEFNTKVILTVVYFTIIFLYSALSRLFGRDPLKLGHNSSQSFWADKKPIDLTRPN